MQASNQKKKLQAHEILYRCIFIMLAMVLVTSYLVSGVFAKYKSVSAASEEARVAKFGNLNLYEYKSDGSTIVNGSSTEIEDITISAGVDINKKISIAFSDNEVATYIFFVVEAENWSLKTDSTTNINRFSINNNLGEYIAMWELNSNWTYLEEATANNKYVFYHLVPPHTNFSDTLMEKIIVNSISLDAADLMETSGYTLSFQAYAAQATNLTPIESYNHAQATN